MPQARITINGSAGSNPALPLNTIVNLGNQDAGGELTYAWTLVDKPVGSSAVLSDPGIEAPTFTPDCEGTYVLQLVVNSGVVGQQRTDAQIAAVAELKSGERVPGATEATQADAVKGWALAVNAILRRSLAKDADFGCFVAWDGTPGAPALTRGDVVRLSGSDVLKTGLPGQETIPACVKALATASLEGVPLFVVEAATVGGTARMTRVRALGQFTGATGAPAAGAPVYVSNAGRLATAPGTCPRRIGTAQGTAGGTFDAWLDDAPPEQRGATLRVDPVYGSDTLGTREGLPFATIAAVAPFSTGGHSYVLSPVLALPYSKPYVVTVDSALQTKLAGANAMPTLAVGIGQKLIALSFGPGVLKTYSSNPALDVADGCSAGSLYGRAYAGLLLRRV